MGKWDKGKMSLSKVRFLFSLDESGVVGPQRKKREEEVWVPIFYFGRDPALFFGLYFFHHRTPN